MRWRVPAFPRNRTGPTRDPEAISGTDGAASPLPPEDWSPSLNRESCRGRDGSSCMLRSGPPTRFARGLEGRDRAGGGRDRVEGGFTFGSGDSTGS